MCDLSSAPTAADIENAIREFNSGKDNPDPALTVLFDQYQENINPDHVLLKAVALNAFYSTQIRAVSDRTPTIYDLAGCIVELKIDAALGRGDEGLVEEIANLTRDGRHQRNYSFATKYCNWHKQDLFPIYDSRVDECLWLMRRRGWIEDFKRQDLYYSYPKLKSVVTGFRGSFGPGKFTYKEIDKFLFVEGGKLLAAKAKDAEGASNRKPAA